MTCQGHVHALVSDEGHDENIAAKNTWLWTGNVGLVNSKQVSHLLLCPSLNHLARVALAVAVTKSDQKKT